MIFHEGLDQLLVAARAVHGLGQGLIRHELGRRTHHLLLDLATIASLHKEDVVAHLLILTSYIFLRTATTHVLLL